MKIGAHISIAGKISEAPKRAAKAGCECFQIFSRSPRGGPAPALTAPVIKEFRSNIERYHQNGSYIHTPYYINLASSNNRIRFGSIKVIREELERGSLLGIDAVMTHLGSAKDLGEAKAQEQVADGLKRILDGYQGSTEFLIEMSAGSGLIIGDTFEEIAKLIKLSGHNEIGVCFDTAHAFASGYDLRTKMAVKKTFDEFDKTLGLKRLKLIHANDSKAEFDSHLDRHDHIGLGKIGQEGFKAILHEPRLKHLNLILETPADGQRVNDVEVLKGLRA
ncbi:MAG: deoxyribonuclease IV [Patescibacteria group bacterium]|nr:deoxyribonuclease IV [Patescibacteria group bacterium]